MPAAISCGESRGIGIQVLRVNWFSNKKPIPSSPQTGLREPRGMKQLEALGQEKGPIGLFVQTLRGLISSAVYEFDIYIYIYILLVVAQF